jgi:regulatory protein
VKPPRAEAAAVQPQPSIKARALALLARREHSRAELERKLAAALRRDAAAAADGAGAAEDQEGVAGRITQALDELAARGLLNDARAAEALVAGRAGRMGQRRLQQALQQKGLAEDVVAATLAPWRASEVQRARAIWQRRFAAAPADAAERARQMRFLAGRGFDGETIRRVLAQPDEND